MADRVEQCDQYRGARPIRMPGSPMRRIGVWRAGVFARAPTRRAKRADTDGSRQSARRGGDQWWLIRPMSALDMKDSMSIRISMRSPTLPMPVMKLVSIDEASSGASLTASFDN